MEQNLQILPKKVWSVLRLFYFMLRKGVSKNKLWLDLHMMMKRAKLAGKALQNLLFNHHHNWAAFTVNRPSPHLSFPSPPPSGEYEFSCTTSPSTNNSHQLSLFPLFQKKHHSGNQVPTADLDIAAFNEAVLKAMEMAVYSETASPALPGFGRSPVVRQLRVTDSPFPLSGAEEDNRVDEAAEQFISRFYNDLRRQKQICGGETMGV
ncbi:hypothetical protein SSX86_013551 [Deinandra increscens subsp. villosa]|uniref:Avr9/Cf-9 rapidly elicited protein 146 n=1 Tax=Deinandra increscens subsp. villosa TaxID=3103831 RepID=A0AAP0D4W8_9ASTR